MDTLPPRKRGSYRKRAKHGKKAMQGAPEPIRDGNEGRWVSDSSITQIGRRKHSSTFTVLPYFQKMDMAACPYTDFSCAGKKRGVARRNPDARKKLVKTKPEIIAEIRDTPPGFCVKEGMPQEEVKGTEGTKGSRTSEKWRSSRGSKKDWTA